MKLIQLLRRGDQAGLDAAEERAVKANDVVVRLRSKRVKNHLSEHLRLTFMPPRGRLR